MSGPVAIAFDFDGVILESVRAKTRAFQRVFTDRGVEASQLTRVAQIHVEHPGHTRFEKFRMMHEELIGPYDAAQDRDLGERFAAAVHQEILACPFVTGALELLKMQASHRPLFVASAAPEEELRQILDSRGIARLFRGVHGAPRRKDDILTSTAAALGVAPARLLFVGDAPSDQAAAAAAGVPFVGRRAPEGLPLDDARALAVVDDLAELQRRWPEIEHAYASTPAGDPE